MLRTYPSLTFESQMKTEVLCGRNTVQIRPGVRQGFNLEEIQKRLQKSVDVKERRIYYHFQWMNIVLFYLQMVGRLFMERMI